MAPHTYVVGQLCSRTRHHVLAMAALDKSLSMVWWRTSAFHSCVVLIHGSLFLSGICYCLRVIWCAIARMSELELEQWMNIKFFVKLGKSGHEIREMLVQVYRDNAMKKTAVYKWVKRFSEGRESFTDWREIRTASNKQNCRKHCKNLSNCAWKSSADCQEHSRASEHRQRNS